MPRRRAANDPASVLAGVLSALLDPDKYRLSWRTVLDSLQNAHINR